VFSGTGSYFDTPSHTSSYVISITPETGFEDVPYTIITEIDGVPTEHERVGTGFVTLDFANGETFTLVTFVKSSEAFDFVGVMEWDIVGGSPDSGTDTTSILSATGIVYFSDKVVDGQINKGQLPKIKVIDFFNGIIKMFNLTVVPLGPTSFDVTTLDDWYAAGEVKDFTVYADMNQETVIRPKLDRVINFNYKEPKTVLQNNFNGTNAVFYGDLEHTNDYDGGTMNIKIPFENVLLSKISNNLNEITDISVGTILDKELNATAIAPFIFYFAGNRTLDNDIAFINDSGTKIAVTSYNVASQENDLTDLAITRSLNWGAEISSYTLTTQTASLFSVYWDDYISDLYDIRRREVKWEAYLPSGITSKLQLNDKLVINNRRYIINQMDMNLTSGKVNFSLLNDLSEVTPLTTNNDGLQYDLQFGLTQ